MMKAALLLIALALAAYLAVCGYFFLNQRAMMYFPTPPASAPAGAQLLQVHNAGETLNVWRTGSGRRGAVIYFGGNAEDVAQSAPMFAHTLPDHAVYLVHYRGYGGSTGTPSESGLFADALAVHDYVRAQHATVSAIGRSLGSGVAMHLAVQRPLHRLALVTPFDSIESVAKHHVPWLPISLLLRDKYRSDRRAANVQVPVLILAAEQDDVIPSRHAQALATALPAARVRFMILPGTGHNDIGAAPNYAALLREFFSD